MSERRIAADQREIERPFSKEFRLRGCGDLLVVDGVLGIINLVKGRKARIALMHRELPIALEKSDGRLLIIPGQSHKIGWLTFSLSQNARIFYFGENWEYRLVYNSRVGDALDLTLETTQPINYQYFRRPVDFYRVMAHQLAQTHAGPNVI
ncbi:hypothetical protein A3D81_00360 [Candidatus Curtissbacteria bacterium RIFCSPHIGHO2_02_FULL_40_17]|uniref:Uncharacterized protein n=3 Tax=Candidatus Curtissiibacteriota TaxID=1752717 RepID=A0A1F5GIX2_9BACT|nr:MAG: hypothetical protein A3D81_00360 [Candidatus Curtissbacteria bacterium RIFCSPHIGHO2_02_FULL_40_17]OGE05781.1 MAG: hypothetical protein A3F45_00910 [Candidatus Curtissbacteria bacterium RIFCSPHIGHO2_12_FULL_41_17]OGE08302.1 MAG: hypothetical protein A3I53_03730 [Candidatus Curtissbacteria bacterium RIFCSPLOWO2_02_FULL_40_13b]